MIILNATERLITGHAGRGRPGDSKPVLIVMHVQEGLNDLPSYFANQQADSTFWCQQNGQLVRMLQDTDTAWTNGDWSQPNLDNPVIADLYRRGIRSNDVSLTIEHQGYASVGFTQSQITSTAELVAYWCQRWNIPCDRDHIVGHYELGEHKGCPGPLFPFSQVIALANQLLLEDGATVDPTPEDDPNSRFFPETGKFVVNLPTDRGVAPFLDYWGSAGENSLPFFGYPITGAYLEEETGRIIQWFERACFEFHPENLDGAKIQLRLLGSLKVQIDH